MRAAADRIMREQEGVITRQQALSTGLSSREIGGLVSRGDWERLHVGVYHLAGAPATPRGLLLAACLARPGAVASHGSAAWLWDLIRSPPQRPELSVPRSASHRSSASTVVRRVSDLREARVVVWKKIPTTNPLRTLVDLAGVAGPGLLDDAVDRGLMAGLVTVEGLAAELDRLGGRGRRGVGALRQALARRGIIRVPRPSVLESRLLRLLDRGGIRPEGVETTVDTETGRYRLDVAVSARVALEVDGYAFHSSADAMGRDLQRHNDLLMHGLVVLRFTWVDVVRAGDQVLAQVREALRRFV